jgi:membrane protein
MAGSERFRWHPRQVLELFRRSLKEWGDDKAPRQAAALAYYTLFALGPLLVVAVVAAGLLFGTEAVARALTAEFGRLVGKEGGDALHDLMAGGMARGETWIGVAVGAVAVLFGAAGVFSQLRESLNVVWEVQEKVPEGWRRKVATAVKRNFLSFVALLGIIFLLVVGLALNALVTAMAAQAQDVLAGPDWLWAILNVAVTMALLTAAFALMFRYLPSARVAWKDVTLGALVTAVLFVVGQALIGLYLAQAATATRYGTAGAVLVVLLWLYYSCLILLFGAEFTQVYANVHGGRVKPTAEAEPLKEGVRRKQGRPEEEGRDRREREKERKKAPDERRKVPAAGTR